MTYYPIADWRKHNHCPYCNAPDGYIGEEELDEEWKHTDEGRTLTVHTAITCHSCHETWFEYTTYQITHLKTEVEEAD